MSVIAAVFDVVLLDIVDDIADVNAPRTTTRLVLLSEFDTAGPTDALEISLLLSSDVVAADGELGQRPIAADGISEGGNTCRKREDAQKWLSNEEAKHMLTRFT
jgi:hypothetical protein